MITFSIIQKSQLEGAIRIDAEYYQPEYLELDDILKNASTINEIAYTVDLQSNGAFKNIFSILNDGKEGAVPYIRSENVGGFFVGENNLDYISLEAHKKLIKTQTKIDDILIARKGRVGGSSIVTKEFINWNTNDNIVNIRLKDNYYNPCYVISFLNSKYGLKQINRFATGNVQPWLSMFQIRSLKIPMANKLLQNELENIIGEANKSVMNLKDFYQQAENLLLEELNLKYFEFDKICSSIVNFSDVMEAQRIDAEYFQPKYEKLISKITSQNHKRLGDLVSMKKGIEVGAEQYQEEGKVFIRVSSLDKFEINESEQKCLSDKLYEKLKADFQPKEGEILLTKDASPGIAHVVKNEIKGIISGGILRLKLKDDEVDNEYLALCLNSIVGKMQAERDAGGSVIQHWKTEQIKNVVIPILPKATQQKIADLVRQSHEARKKAKSLLNEAKEKVESLIENK